MKRWVKMLRNLNKTTKSAAKVNTPIEHLVYWSATFSGVILSVFIWM